jgi:hypothetical protein
MKILTRCTKQSQQSVLSLSKTISELLHLKVCLLCLYFCSSMDDLVDNTSNAINCTISLTHLKTMMSNTAMLLPSILFMCCLCCVALIIYGLTISNFVYHSTMYCPSVMCIHNLPRIQQSLQGFYSRG